MDNETYNPNDLDSIEELNYISTYEEDSVINEFIDKLREWGFGSINEMKDLNELFWFLANKGVLLSKLNRVAVVECIEQESLYVPFLKMARHFNYCMMNHQKKQKTEVTALSRQVEQANQNTEDVKRKLLDVRMENVTLKQEITKLKLQMKPQSESAQVNNLRHELKREYNKQLEEVRRKHRPAKLLRVKLLRELTNPDSAVCSAYDLTLAEDADAYIEWFRIAHRKINNPTMKEIREHYEGQDISAFEERVEKYNLEWADGDFGDEED